MKRFAIIATAVAAMGVSAMAENTLPGVTIDSYSLERNGAYLSVGLDLDLSKLDVESNRAVLLQPRLVTEADTLDLPAVGIYGRRRYYYYQRNFDGMISGKDEASYRSNDFPRRYDYSTMVDYAEWMNGAQLEVYRKDCGCCRKLLAEDIYPVGGYFEPVPFEPTLLYVRPQGQLGKDRALEGRAFVDFPVDKTYIRPEYRNNVAELGKIRATIDSVRNDKDITITQVWLKGFASPESPYSHNRDLAIGRTAALKEYIQNLYRFEPGIIATDYEPEDWDGLRRFVENSGLEHRDQILDLINSDMQPDPKEHKIRALYPQEYRFMLQNYYPALRHTDYRIAYTIRVFTDIEEIKRVMAEAPQKLSLNEFYLVAQEYEPGTQEFTDVFETAVRLFPNDQPANLNAASAAIARKDYVSAARYLEKSGDSGEAEYTRGILALINEDYVAARRYLERAQRAGVVEADEAIEHINSLKK